MLHLIPSCFRRWIATQSSLKLKDFTSLGLLRNAYLGKRCFVVGSGPSLKIEDLDLLHGENEFCISSNKIYLAFEKTPWRPDFYSVADWCVAENNRERIPQLDLVKLFPNELKCYFGGNGSNPNQSGKSIFFQQIVPPKRPDDEYESYFSEDIQKGVFVGETITNFNIQLAAYLGFSEIYLIGVDGYYAIPNQKKEHKLYGEVLVADNANNHFLPEYRNEGETWSLPRVTCHESNYTKCREELEKRKIILKNASRNTFIESLERVEFDSLFL